jgi:hypothetical protein
MRTRAAAAVLALGVVACGAPSEPDVAPARPEPLVRGEGEIERVGRGELILRDATGRATSYALDPDAVVREARHLRTARALLPEEHVRVGLTRRSGMWHVREVELLPVPDLARRARRRIPVK